MEKYSQYRDRGSGIAPFFPVAPQPSGWALPFHVFLFFVRSCMLLAASIAYLAVRWLVLPWLPYRSLVKKAALWVLIGIPGIWWIDLQLDGVKKGSLAKQPPNRLPQPGTIIAASSTSPIDCLYLAAIFDPIFTASYPRTRKVHRISLAQALLRSLLPPPTRPPPNQRLTTLHRLLAEYPESIIVVQPECTTTNGRAILPFSPSLVSVPKSTRIFPVSIRYTPADITTPVPGVYLSLLWNLCSRPTHCIRVRIAECVYNDAADREDSSLSATAKERNSYETNFFDSLGIAGTDYNKDGPPDAEERKLLDKIGEALARLGRVKRVALGVEEKTEFVAAWKRKNKVF